MFAQVLEVLDARNRAECSLELAPRPPVERRDLAREQAADLAVQRSPSLGHARPQPCRVGQDERCGADHRAGSLVDREPLLHERVDPISARSVSPWRFEEVTDLRELARDPGLDERVEILEMAEDRSLGDAGTRRDLGRARLQYAVLVQAEERVDHRSSTAFAAQAPAVGRVVAIGGVREGHAVTLWERRVTVNNY